ncbi:MAG: FMN-binding protein [Pseudomonadales bacterium]
MIRALTTVAFLTVACALLLWAVNAATANPIADARQRAMQASLAKLAQGAALLRADDLAHWPVRLCDGISLVRANGRGYGGAIELALALTPTDAAPTITNLLVLHHSETPGIGDFIADPQGDRWLARFIDQTPTTLLARPEQLDAVSGATITVAAIRKTLKQALAAASAEADLFSSAGCS